MADQFLSGGSGTTQGKPAFEFTGNLATNLSFGYTIFTPSPPLFNPRNHQDQEGRYHMVRVESGDVIYRRSDFGTLPYVVETQVTDTGDNAYPCIVEDLLRNALILLYQSATDVEEVVSYDDGVTWTSPSVAIPDAKFPNVAVGTDHGFPILRCGVVSSNVYLTRQEKGETVAGDPFLMVDQDGVAIEVEEDTVGLAQCWGEGAARWTAELNVTGDGTTSTWESADDGDSWIRSA